MYTINGKYRAIENFNQLTTLSEGGNVINLEESNQINNNIPLNGTNSNPGYTNGVITRHSPINPISKSWDYNTNIYFCIKDKCFTEDELKKLSKICNKN